MVFVFPIFLVHEAVIINHGTPHDQRISFYSFLFELTFDRGGGKGSENWTTHTVQ